VLPVAEEIVFVNTLLLETQVDLTEFYRKRTVVIPDTTSPVDAVRFTADKKLVKVVV